MALSATALTDYATVAAQIGLTAPTDQALIESFINVASDRLAKFCKRVLIYGVRTELMAMFGGPILQVEGSPLVGVPASVTIDGSLVDPTTYFVHDAGAGQLWSDSGWPWSALLRPGLNFDRDVSPGTEKKTCQAVYGAGYLTGPQAVAATPWPAPAQQQIVGQYIKPAGQPTQVWMVTAASTGTGVGTTGGSEPAWPASPVQGVTAITDGQLTWTFIGTAGAAGSRGTAVTLPSDLEQACVETAKALYRGRKRDPNIQSESLLGTSVTYALNAVTGLPPTAEAMARAYRRTD